MLLSAFSLLSASDYYTGRGKEDKSFFMLEPVMKNVDAGDRAWLPSAISSPLKSSLKMFTGMTPVNFENTAKIQDIQKKVESGAYDASRAVIEAGKLQDADYGVFVTVTKTGSTYQLAVSLTNLTTGREEATCSINNVAKATDLQETAINAAIIKLAPQLGVKLTALGLYTLSNSSDGSLDEQIALAKQEAASYQATIDALNKELQGLNTASAMTEQEALAKKAAAETEKQLYEQRQLAAQQKAARLLEQKQKADLEAQAATARSDDATRKLGQLSSEAENIAARVRARQMAEMNASDRITVIENKKAAYMKIVQQVQDEEDAYWDQANIDYNAGYVDPDDPANYPPAYYKDGIFNQDYRQMLINENEQLRLALINETNNNISAAHAATDETLATLLNEIRSDLKALSTTTFTLSSLEYPEIFNISSYDPNNYAWYADLNFTIFNQSCQIVSTLLTYEDVTGEPLPQFKTRQDFDDYAATYDIYDAMFRMGTPFLTLEMTYTIEPDDDAHPSCYFICMKDYSLSRTTDGKLLKRSDLSSEQLSLQYYPITDMRTTGETITVSETREEEKRQETAKAEKKARQEEKERKAAQRELDYYLQPELGMGPGIWGALTYTTGAGSGIGFDAGVDLKFPGFSLNMGAHSIPTEADRTIVSLDFGLLFEHEKNLLGKKCFPYWGLQLGPAFYTFTDASNASDVTISGITMNTSSSYSSANDDMGVCFSLAGNFGIFFPLTDRIALKTQYSLQMIAVDSSVFWSDRVSVGMAFFILEGMSSDEFWGD